MQLRELVILILIVASVLIAFSGFVIDIQPVHLKGFWKMEGYVPYQIPLCMIFLTAAIKLSNIRKP
jgi:hypothetical protein